MSEATNTINQIARQLFAMSQKKKDKDLVSSLQNEKYQRTMTDEYPFSKIARGRFRPVDDEQKEQWRKLAERGQL